MDCFTQDWGKECNNFFCPPPHLISAVLYHMESCKAKGTLVVPAESGNLRLFGHCYVFLIVRFYFKTLLRIFVVYLNHVICLFLVGVHLLFILTKGPFFLACPGLMFSLFVWIFPAKRVIFDFLITRMLFFICFFI